MSMVKAWRTSLPLAVIGGLFAVSVATADWQSARSGSEPHRETGTLLLDGSTSNPTREWRYDLTLSSPDQFQLLLSWASDPTTVRRVLWAEESGEIQLWDGARGVFGFVSDSSRALDLALGEGAADGFRELLPNTELAEPDGVVTESEQSCGETTCSVFLLSFDRETVRSRLWIDRVQEMLLRVETEIDSPEAVIARAMGTSLESPGTQRWERRVETWAPLEESAKALFLPPDGTPRVASWPAASYQNDPQDSTATRAQFGETIEVDVVTLIVRAVNFDGAPIANLTPNDLRVRLGRQETNILAVDWVNLNSYDLSSIPRTPRTTQVIGSTTPLPTPPLILFFRSSGTGQFIHAGRHAIQPVGR